MKQKFKSLRLLIQSRNTQSSVSCFIKSDSLATHFTDQNIAWALVNLPYETEIGAKRLKSLFINWVPDALSRPSFRETVRLKSNGVYWAGLVKSQLESVDCLYQANAVDDLQAGAFLARASRFERDQVDPASVARYWPN